MRVLTSLVIGIALVSSGCGGNSVERNDVSGSVTFDGEPIVFGSITFIPRHDDGTEAPTGDAVIENGQFDTALSGQGIAAGPHEIRITAFPSRPVETEDETLEVEAVEPLFVDFSINADIQPPTHDIEVPSEAEGFDASKAADQASANDP